MFNGLRRLFLIRLRLATVCVNAGVRDRVLTCAHTDTATIANPLPLTSLSTVGVMQRRRRFVVAVVVGGIPGRDRSCYVNLSCIL